MAAPEGLQVISDDPAVLVEVGEKPVLGAVFLSKSRMTLLDGSQLELAFVSEDIEGPGDDAMGVTAAFQRFVLTEPAAAELGDRVCGGRARLMAAVVHDAEPRKTNLWFYSESSFDEFGSDTSPCAELKLDRVQVSGASPVPAPAVAAATDRPLAPDDPTSGIPASEAAEVVDPEDMISGPPNPALAPPRPGTGPGKWRKSIQTNPMDDSKTVALVLLADEGRSTMGEPVTLYARCKSNTTEVYIDWNDYLGDDSRDVYSDWKNVQVRLGTKPAMEQRWDVSTDNEATFAPAWAGSLLQQMVGEDQMVVRTTPYNENPVTAVFDIRGLEHPLRELADTCGWSFVVPKP